MKTKVQHLAILAGATLIAGAMSVSAADPDQPGKNSTGTVIQKPATSGDSKDSGKTGTAGTAPTGTATGGSAAEAHPGAAANAAKGARDATDKADKASGSK